MFRTKRGSKKEELKTVRVVSKEQVHICTDDCFKQRKTRKPAGLTRINLGYIYRDKKGRCYTEWNDGEWLEVTGVEFVEGSGVLCLMFLPKEQLHIHSRGGRTTALITDQRDDPGNEHYHAEAAARILLQQKKNLKDSRNFLAAKAAKIIPRAPRTKKPRSGRGRGAPGMPRSPRGLKIAELISEGKTKRQIVAETIVWTKERGENVAGPFQTNIKKHVHRLWAKTNVSHK